MELTRDELVVFQIALEYWRNLNQRQGIQVPQVDELLAKVSAELNKNK